MINVPDTFDIETLFNYLKEKDDLHFGLEFGSNIFDDYLARLEVIVDELIATPESTYFRFPYLKIPNLDHDKQNELFRRFVEDYTRRNH